MESGSEARSGAVARRGGFASELTRTAELLNEAVRAAEDPEIGEEENLPTRNCSRVRQAVTMAIGPNSLTREPIPPFPREELFSMRFTAR
jgi:hypothetical protein